MRKLSHGHQNVNMKSTRVVMCDLDRYGRIVFDLSTGVKKTYLCEIQSNLYSKAGLLNIKFDTKSNSLILFNNFASAKEVSISLSNYGRVVIVCLSGGKATKFVRYDKALSYNFHLFTATWNTPRNNKVAKIEKADKPKLRRKPFKRINNRKRADSRKRVSSLAELQKDPLVLKKSKYRYKVKAY